MADVRAVFSVELENEGMEKERKNSSKTFFGCHLSFLLAKVVSFRLSAAQEDWGGLG